MSAAQDAFLSQVAFRLTRAGVSCETRDGMVVVPGRRMAARVDRVTATGGVRLTVSRQDSGGEVEVWRGRCAALGLAYDRVASALASGHGRVF